MTQRVRVSDYLASALVGAGVKHVFMLTGGGAMHLNDALGHTPGLEVVCCHHEQALAMAADAYTRVSGRLSCVNVTTGPGGVNALNGVFGAYTDSIGMVVLSGQVKRETIMTNTGLPLRQLGDQEVNIVDMVRTITKYAVLLQDPAQTRYTMEKALWMAQSGRPGPVWIDVPVDVQAALIDPSTQRGFDPKADWAGEDYALPTEARRLRGEALSASVAKVLSVLKEAKRPVLMAGTGIRISGSYDIFHRVIEKLGMPVTTCWNAHDLMWTDHPLFAGRPSPIGDRAGNFVVQNSDAVLVLGCRLSIRQVGYNYKSFARHATRMMVDIDKAEFVKPTVSIDVPVHADLMEFFTEMERQLDGYQIQQSHTDYQAWAIERRRRFPAVLPRHWDSKDCINPYVFAKTLFDELEENEIVCTGDGTACTVTFQAAELKRGQRLFHNNGAASMGFDVPGAIGAWYTDKPRRVISIAGDGSIMQNIQELQTIAGAGIPVKIFVLNNNGYHSIRQTQANFFNGATVGCGPESGITFPSFEKLASGFSLPYVKATNHDDMLDAIRTALAMPGPCVCEVILDQAQVFEPKLGSRRLEDGSMITSPLEDMSPLLSREELHDNMIVPAER